MGKSTPTSAKAASKTPQAAKDSAARGMSRLVPLAAVVALVGAVAAHVLYGDSRAASSVVLDALRAVGASSGSPPLSPARTLTTHEEHNVSTSHDGALKPCVDHSEHCDTWAKLGECGKNPRFMTISCPRACDTCASTASAPPLPPLPAKTVQSSSKAAVGHGETVDEDEECKDENPSCAHWAATGECSKNKIYMHTSCPQSCGTCKELKKACERVEGSQAFQDKAGSLNAMFERALTDFKQYNPTVLSRDPWLISFDNFITVEEGNAFLEHANESFARSLAGDQVSPVRTSNQFWCSTAKCLADKRISGVVDRVSDITTIPPNNFEYFQVLRYEPGQFYKSHHDQNCAPWTPQGVRVLTFYIYLNDVEEGGGTRFTDIDITMQPKRGRAVMWPSVLDSDLTQLEPMTHHEAIAPVSGTKFGANLWGHQFDFKTPSSKGCKWTG
eukprot:CAMPEP_0119410100 /NCGR_PEP_ID=MMETSP1335-20130426/3217_1 /TAXON_ID=259385 /ORGANISM="Chrysoculter rhomboideus, Strain RCC1486" /LENGTH=443 /DNA_ID=CAMNT_0007434575 /DNA_START=58 /DNA_END=1385 /DNA_ORIENTATION=+